jgi:hypothetical protein
MFCSTDFIKTGFTFADVHPDEAQWVNGRQAQTSNSILNLINTFAPGAGVTAVPADFHVAVAHSGGGKRAFFNSLGNDLAFTDTPAWLCLGSFI